MEDVDEISFNENKDFPEYANEKNKELNEKVKETKKHITLVDKSVDENRDRYRLLDEHYKNIKEVKSKIFSFYPLCYKLFGREEHWVAHKLEGITLKEIKFTEQTIELKKSQRESEDHMNRLSVKKVDKLTKELKQFEEEAEEQQSKVNDVQQKIFEGNQRLEKLKSKINLNQEDMEKWMLAAKQKKEDNLMLEKYKRGDETKVKEIGLEIQRLTLERGKLKDALAKQITETKACQIEIDKLLEEFKSHSEQRQRVFSHWDSVVMSLSKRNQLQLEIGEKMVRLQKEIAEKAEISEEKVKYLRREREQNTVKNEEIKKLERENFQSKNQNYKLGQDTLDFKAEIKIIQNRLSGRASELES